MTGTQFIGQTSRNRKTFLYEHTKADGTKAILCALAYTSGTALKALKEAGDWQDLTLVKNVTRHELLHDAIEQAKDFLGIEWDIDLKVIHNVSGTHGTHGVEMQGGRVTHVIRLKRWLHAEQASRVLWHELAHAMQTEREARIAGAAADDIYGVCRAWRESGMSSGAYESRECEVEAREYEDFSDEISLARSLA